MESSGGLDLCWSLPCHIFPELKFKLELLEAGWNADLSDDQMDAL
jgi:hypothetical protein